MAKGENRIDQMMNIIKEMTILELRDLNQRIQDEFGITAAAPLAVAAAPVAGRRGGAKIAWYDRPAPRGETAHIARLVRPRRCCRRQEASAPGGAAAMNCYA